MRRLAARRGHCRGNARRAAATPAHCGWRKPALVLDIDETALSNYAFLGDFKNILASLAQGAIGGTLPAIAPTLSLYDVARAKGVAVFFITGRPTVFESPRSRT